LNQTKRAMGRPAGAPKEKNPRGYGMSRQVKPQLFEEIMCGAYIKNVIVEEHFEAFTRNNTRSSVQGLELKQFSQAISNLGLRWNERDCEFLFNSIFEAFNPGN